MSDEAPQEAIAAVEKVEEAKEITVPSDEQPQSMQEDQIESLDVS